MNLPPPKTRLVRRSSPGDLAIAAGIRARYPVYETSEQAVRPTRGASTRRFLLRRLPARKGTKGRFGRREAASLVQTEEPVFAPRAARRVCTSPRSITFAYLLLLLLHLLLLLPLLPPPASSPLPPPFPSVCYSALSPLTALNCRQRASPDRRLLKPLSRSGTPACAAARRD